MPRKNPFGSSYVEKRGGVFYFRFTFPLTSPALLAAEAFGFHSEPLTDSRHITEPPPCSTRFAG